MESLCSPWGLPPPAYGYGLQQNRSRFGSTLEIRDTCPVSAQQDLLPRRQRSPSLPPISNFQHDQSNNFDNTENNSIKYSIVKQSSEHRESNGNVKYRYDDIEGETSGYASDCAPQSSPEFWQNKSKQANNRRTDNNIESDFNIDTRNNLPIAAWHRNPNQEDDRVKKWTREISTEEHRPRWGDRGVAAGRLWEPREPGARLPQMPTKGTPSWVERSLNMIDHGDSQILVIDQHSNGSIKGDVAEYRTMSETQSEKNTYLLGQNTPIEPTIKAEREYRRLKALELQAAIMQQLEDRERQKREEKERQIREEREEEERFRKQQELERQRLEEERRIVEEKQKREQKRAEALRLALERAEQQAKIDKENKKNLRRYRENFDAMSLNSETEKSSLARSPRNESTQHSIMNGESKLIQNIYIEQAFSPRRKTTQEQMNNSYVNPGTTETNIIMSNPQSATFRHQTESISNEQNVKKTEIPKQTFSETQNTNVYQGNQSLSILPDTPLSLVQIPITQELFAPINFAHNSGVQMALLVPSSVNNVYPCIHQPVSMQALFSADISNLQKNNYHIHSQTDTDDASTSKDMKNKILTPSKYRNCKDASTQTDAETISLKSLGIVEEKGKRRTKSNDNEFYTNVEQNTSEEKLNSLTNKKEKRHQSEERLVNKDLENRPKWGVNKPPTQYKKQSEKDIFYTQKRKLRLRKRMQEKNYTSHSSDDNRSPSPVLVSIKNTTDKNRISLTDYHWRKKIERQEKNPYPRNLIMETTQISPLECDSNGVIQVNENFSVTNKRTYEPKKMLSKNGMSVSQKFTNDKYGNPKFWQSDKQDDMLPSDIINNDNKTFEEDNNSKFKEKIENKKKYNDNINKTKRDRSNYYKQQEIPQPIVLDQLRSLKESLKKQQQIWGKYDVRRSPSPKNEVDLEMD